MDCVTASLKPPPGGDRAGILRPGAGKGAGAFRAWHRPPWLPPCRSTATMSRPACPLKGISTPARRTGRSYGCARWRSGIFRRSGFRCAAGGCLTSRTAKARRAWPSSTRPWRGVSGPARTRWASTWATRSPTTSRLSGWWPMCGIRMPPKKGWSRCSFPTASRGRRRPSWRCGPIPRSGTIPCCWRPRSNALWAMQSPVTELAQVAAERLAPQRLTMAVVAVFAGLALVLAAIGIYGVLSFAVTERTHEIGVRMALGAPRGRVLRTIVGQAAGLAVAGIAIGMAGVAGGLARAGKPVVRRARDRSPGVRGRFRRAAGSGGGGRLASRPARRARGSRNRPAGHG